MTKPLNYALFAAGIHLIAQQIKPAFLLFYYIIRLVFTGLKSQCSFRNYRGVLDLAGSFLSIPFKSEVEGFSGLHTLFVLLGIKSFN